MSSSGSGSPSITPPSDNCRELIINTNLSSPRPNVVDNLNEGDILSVSAASASGPLQVINDQGEVAGNIISREQARLLNCIVNEGIEYQAEILSIDEGLCQVQIRAI